jgi:hypothetical protein
MSKFIFLGVFLLIGNGSLIALWYQLRPAINNDQKKQTIKKNLAIIGIMMSVLIMAGTLL